MPYQVGHLLDIQPDDPTFDEREQADDCAIEGSIDDDAWGVWSGQNEGSELLAIAYQGELFEK